VVQHVWYSDKTAQLKTPQGIFEWFVACLLNQSVSPEHLFRVLNDLRNGGWLNYEKLRTLLVTDPAKLKADLREALKSYRFPNKATKAILINVERTEKEYKGNLHNIFHFSKDTAEVWKRVNDLYWFGSKKAGVFIRELVVQGLWDLVLEQIPIPPDSRVKRVLFRLGFLEHRGDLKEVEQAAKKLAKEAKISCLDLDCALWLVGGICTERKPPCEKCPLDFYCPSFLPSK